MDKFSYFIIKNFYSSKDNIKLPCCNWLPLLVLWLLCCRFLGAPRPLLPRMEEEISVRDIDKGCAHANLALLVMTPLGPCSHPSSGAPNTRASWLAWSRRIATWATRPRASAASGPSSTPLSTALSPTGVTWRRSSTTLFTVNCVWPLRSTLCG